ncbi:gliding motility-associated C-terminal domain-containing protein [Adhaeribacter radiodurans]|uniref:Gliding motility-associated C-terminal domain-containing protein n=1 Tax=Adhaeribacter radiodurans TaxID=2745197 RepID=A0A7L7L4T8_9BACT|nr:gliding motility-associated C-terminal domain-containing protein [Adhaeribacter radiodurans]QMU27783.1 gliding motility-associated C-terminal domain-containing protein [Adhaeribacter radiodurans]
MKLRLLFLLFIGCFTLTARATHIVGGEFELEHLSSSNYRLTLNMYFDNLNGNPGALDPDLVASIFDKQTNELMQQVYLPLTSSVPVAYTSIACTNSSLSTQKLVYTSTVQLSPFMYTSPQGYYVVWERCCRNNVISNIVSPQNAGQAFYLEFPAVVKNNKPFVNSSPKLFPPLSDYACINELFYYDFSGSDTDGDSLVYEMITPLNGYSTPFDPLPEFPSSGPYPTISWAAGLGINNQIPGNPGMSIDRFTGRLVVQPSRLGLFVFGVRCIEYRDNIRIGETRRDFQLLVLNCPTNAKPQITAQVQGQKVSYREGDTLRLTPDGNHCLDIFIMDPDPDEPLTISYRPVNFTMTDKILSVTQGVVNQGGQRDSLKATLCFPGCLDSKGKTYLLDVMVKDNGCSLPKADTVHLTIIAEPVPNEPPTIRTTAPDTVLTAKMGDVITFDAIGTDPDEEEVTVKLEPRNFKLGSQKITFSTASGPGAVTVPFRWEIDCSATGQNSYLLDFVATSMVCGQPVSKITTVEVRIDNPNAPPQLKTLLEGQTITIPFGGSVNDSIFGLDPDVNPIILSAAGEDFNLADYGMQFTPASGNGSARTAFSWTPDCRSLDRESYKVNFSVQEQACQPHAILVKSVIFLVQPPNTTSFIPANVFTPNNDGLNDYFQMPNLPPNYCESIFASITIFNRWGNQVYNSTNREFKWDGHNATDGVYYYLIKFSDKEYKGHVTLVH